MKLLIINFFFCFFFFKYSTADSKQELQTAMVVGTVYCNTCSHQHFSKSSHFISGASVAVECSKPSFTKETKTNQHGLFEVHLPLKIIKSCSVKLIKSSDPLCSIPSSSFTSISFNLKSKINDLHVFSAGLFTFCFQQPKPVVKAESVSEQDQSQRQQPEFFFPPPINPSLGTAPIVGRVPVISPPPTIGRTPLSPDPITTPPTLPTIGGRTPLLPNPLITSPPSVGGRTPLPPNPITTPLLSPPIAFNYPSFPFPFPFPFPYNPQFPGIPPAVPRPKETSP